MCVYVSVVPSTCPGCNVLTCILSDPITGGLLRYRCQCKRSNLSFRDDLGPEWSYSLSGVYINVLKDHPLNCQDLLKHVLTQHCHRKYPFLLYEIFSFLAAKAWAVHCWLKTTHSAVAKGIWYMCLFASWDWRCTIKFRRELTYLGMSTCDWITQVAC